MPTPLVSVVMPTYNAEMYLQEAVDSLLNQTFTNFELLVIDDYSKDNTRKIIKSYKDKRIKLIDGPRKGLAAALNYGIKIAKGMYIARMDADDIALPERFAKEVEFLEKHKDISLVGSWQQKFGSSNGVHCPAENHDEIKLRLLFSCDMCHSTIMWRRQDFLQNDLFYDETSPQEDYELWLRAIKKVKFHNLQEVLGKYRVSGKSISDKKAILLRDYEAQLIQRNIESFFHFKVNQEEYGVLQKRMIEGCHKDENKKIARNNFFNKLLKINGEKHYTNQNELKTTLEWLWEHTICGKWQDFVEQQSKKIKISIIVPVYNVKEYIDIALKSALSQTLKDIEVICINDGSTDNSLSVLENWSLKDSRIVLLSQKNQGAGPARNYGINFARGKYIAFLDPDDYYPSDSTLELMYSTGERERALIVGGSLWEDRKGTYKKEFCPFPNFGYIFKKDGFVDYKDYQFDYSYQRFIYRTDFIKKNNLYFPALRRFQDPPFFIDAMLKAKSFYALKEPTYVYRYDYKSVRWNKEKIKDLVAGLLYNLNISKQNQLAQLHYLTYYRILREFNHALFRKISWYAIKNLKKIQDSLDTKLIRQINPGFKSELTFCNVFFGDDLYQTKYCLKAFGFLPILKVKEAKDMRIYSFFSIPLIKKVSRMQSIKYFVFDCIPLIKIKHK